MFSHPLRDADLGEDEFDICVDVVVADKMAGAGGPLVPVTASKVGAQP